MAKRRLAMVPELPHDLWDVLAQHRPAHPSLVRVCVAAREAVLAAVGKRRGLNRLQALAYVRVVHLYQTLFLTGAAGTGKTHAVRAITRRLSKHENAHSAMALVAPSGAAAQVASTPGLHAHSVTRFFNVKMRERARHAPAAQVETRVPEALLLASVNLEVAIEDCPAERASGLPTAVLDRPTRKRLRALQLLVIDEVATLGADLLDLIDAALRLARDTAKPFGGVQLLVAGDLFGLGPVSEPHDEPRLAFEAAQWRHLPTLELLEPVRHRANPRFAQVLGRLRRGHASEADVAYINAHACSDASREAELVVRATEGGCSVVNQARLDGLPGKPWRYAPEVRVVELIERRPFWRTRGVRATHAELAPASCTEPVVLKVGAVVLSTSHIYEPSPLRARTGALLVASGQRGVVIHLSEHAVTVRWFGAPPRVTVVHTSVTMRRQTFRSRRGLPVFVSVRHMPLRLAFAIPLACAQGGSFTDLVDLDVRTIESTPCGNRYRPRAGAAYTALARCARLEDVRLAAPLSPLHVRADARVCAWEASAA